MAREPSGRHVLDRATDLDGEHEDAPEPRRVVRKNDVTISLPVKALTGVILAALGGGGVYGGHMLGSQKGERAVAELQAMDTRVRQIEDGRLRDDGERKALIQKIDDRFDAIKGKIDDIGDGIEKINARLDNRRR
jgi:hypothetical protein